MSVCMYPPSEPRCTPIQEEMVFSMSRCSTPARTLEGGMDSSRRAALLHDYFKNNSALTRSIIMEKTTLEQQHRHNWSVLSESRRDQLVNEYFVPSGVREQYEGGFVGGSGWRRGIKSTRSLHLSQSEHDERDGELESTDSLSQTMQTDRIHQARSLEPHTGLKKQPSTSEQTPFTRTKLRSYSMRMNKGASGSRLAKINGRNRNGEGSRLQGEEIIPLFERDVNELDNDVDLPDESLMNDHMPTDEKEAGFARLRPLRYSFGHKMKNKVNHSGASTPTLEPNDFIITNQHTDSVYMGEKSNPTIRVETPSDMSISQTPSALLDERPSVHTDSRMVSTPLGMLSDDAISMTSRQSTRTPDSAFSHSSSMKHKQRTVEMNLKHPLSKSVRAGSSYMTVTSEFADRRQQFRAQMRKRTNSNISPSSSPIPPEDSDALSANSLPSPECAKPSHGPSPLLKTIPMTKTNSLAESSATDLTASSTELLSPSCSPPASPPAHSIANKRESGYMSSTYDPLEDGDADLSDVEEKPSATNERRRYKKHRQVRPSYLDRTMASTY